MASTVISTNKNKATNCNFQNALNTDCWATVFAYLEVEDLLTLSSMDDYFQQIIHDHVIRNKKISFNCENNHLNGSLIFNDFGQRIKKLQFSGVSQAFCNLLDQIIQFCSPDQFHEVDIDLIWNGMIYESDKWCINRAHKYFSNVKSLSLSNDYVCNGGINELMQILFQEAEHLRKLKLKKINIISFAGNIFDWDRLLQLTELELVNVNIDPEFMLSFIEKGPLIERFINEHSIETRDIERIGNALAKHCANSILYFKDANCCFLYGDEYLARYQFISKFANLKAMAITSLYECGSDLYFALNGLAEHNNLERLAVAVNLPKMPPKLKRAFRLSKMFTKLRVVEVDYGFVNKSIKSLDFLVQNKFKHISLNG